VALAPPMLPAGPAEVARLVLYSIATIYGFWCRDDYGLTVTEPRSLATTLQVPPQKRITSPLSRGMQAVQ
jgi:hypothetical protein